MLPRTITRCFTGCVVVAALAAPASAATREAEKIAASVIAQMREATLYAQQRANAIAGAPSLVYAVATDQQTMLDMTADELSFHAKAGEIVEVGQRQLQSGKVIPLRREGSDAGLVHLPLERAGLFVISNGENLYALAVVEVRPRERADVLRGMVGVARTIDLGEAASRFERLGAGALIRTGNGTIVVGHKPSSATAIELYAPLGTDVDPQLTLLLPGSQKPLIGALAAVGLAAFAVAFVLLRRRRASHGDELAYRHRADAR